MARGNPQASGAAGQLNSNANGYNANASQLYGDLTPTLESEVANPQGFGPTDEAALETGAQQNAAGAAAGATGAGQLSAARTRNAGSFGKAVSDATRGAGENLSKNLLGIRTANAGLKNSQQQAGISGLENLTGLETGATNTALGNVAPNVQANNAAIGQSWDWANDILGPALAAGGAVGAAKVGG